MSYHFKYGGSTATRTLNCGAWTRLGKGAPYQTPSYAASLGTALHTIIELCMLDPDYDPYSFIETTTVDETEIEITKEHIDEKIIPALEDFEALMDTYDVDEYWCELSGSLNDLVGGTADFVGLSADRKTLVMGDYKSGDGILVFAKENAQLLFYVMCVMASAHASAFEQVERLALAVVQPSERKENTLDVWECDMDYLSEWGAEFLKAVVVNESDKGLPVVGDHCKFCPSEAIGCPAKEQAVAEARGMVMTRDQRDELSKALELADEMENWIKAVRRLAHATGEEGIHIEGWKVVDKRPSRVWNDKEEAYERSFDLDLDEEDVYEPRKFRSPPQIEKLCKAKGIDFEEEFGEYVSKVSSGTTLVRESDSREAIKPSSGAKLLASRFAD